MNRRFLIFSQEITEIKNETERQKALFTLDAQQTIVETINALGAEVKNLNDLKSDEGRKLALC